MKPRMTIEEVKQKLAAGTIRAYKINNPKSIVLPVEQKKTKKRPKYGNKKTVVDGIEFDSAKEANRYKELKLLLKTGEIGLLELQKKYDLIVEGKKVCSYIADFVYIEMKTGGTIVEDVKSTATRKLPTYRLKKKLMKAIYNIEIKEK